MAEHDSMASMNPEDLQYIIEHIFLPPRLPDSHDKNSDQKQHTLARVIFRIAKQFRANDEERWTRILQLLENVQNTYDSLALSETQVVECINRMQDGGNLTMLFLPLLLITIHHRCPGPPHSRAKRWHYHA